MKQWVGYILLALCLVLAYQGYGNVSNSTATQAAAKAVACEGIPECGLTQEKPRAFKSNVVSRRYQWATSVGPVTTTCRRTAIFFGAWQCTSAKGAELAP
jgi:hypothetical protein